jgi:hypothetical protein
MTDRIVGPSGGKRRRRFLALFSFAVLAALAFAISSFAGPIGTQQGFEDDDGNLVDNATTGIDWNSFSRVNWLPSPKSTPTREADKVASGFTFKGIEDWQATTADSGFAGGTKQDDNCATVTSAKAPNKDDLKRIYLASKTVGGHTYLDLAWARIPQNTTSASAHVGFEFNQGTTPCGPASDGLVQRTAGDMLIVYDFEGGSADPVITLRRWVTSGACEVSSDSAPCWGTAVNLTASGFAEAKVNVGTTVLDQLAPPALSSTTGTSVDQNLNDSEFGEAGIDLTAAGVFGANTCNSFGKAYAVSRSSGNSGQAQMKDLVGPANFNLTNCGQIKIIEHTAPRGLNQNFSYTSNIAGAQLSCTADTTPATFTLNDSAGVDNSTNTETCANVPAGSYTVTEGADPAGFTFTDLSCTATGTGTSATPASGNATRTASITMAGGGNVTCTYTNTQQLGAIEITKTGKDKSKSGDQNLAGATFSITGPNSYSNSVTTGSDGTVCVDGLEFGGYTVTETGAPAGYAIDDTSGKTVTVNANSTCGDGNEATQAFTDTPLTDLTVNATAQSDGANGTGATESSIQCTDSSNGDIGHDPADADTGGTTNPAEVDAKGLKPGTYTCEVVIDP